MPARLQLGKSRHRPIIKGRHRRHPDQRAPVKDKARSGKLLFPAPAAIFRPVLLKRGLGALVIALLHHQPPAFFGPRDHGLDFLAGQNQSPVHHLPAGPGWDDAMVVHFTLVQEALALNLNPNLALNPK